MKIPISRPYIGNEEKEAVLRVLDSGHLVQGKTVEAFEAEFARYHHAEHGIAVNSGTAALIAALMAHGIGTGDEVIVPAFTFFATAAAVLSVGAKVVFADIDPLTYCISPDSVAAVITPQTAAVIAVHLYGQVAAMPVLQEICVRHGLLLLEDAAQAHGAALGDQFVGSWGTCAFSFYASKNMMTGEGGMILTNDAALADRLRAIRNQGMRDTYHHEVLGYNFRMTEIAAALGLAQLSRLPQWTEQRRMNAQFLDTSLQGVATPFVQPHAHHAYHQYTVRVSEGADRDAIVTALHGRGIDARVYYPLPLYRQPVFANMGVAIELPEAERAAREVFSLPIFPDLTAAERDYIVDVVNATVQQEIHHLPTLDHD